jgi:hypothetical protein
MKISQNKKEKIFEQILAFLYSINPNLVTHGDEDSPLLSYHPDNPLHGCSSSQTATTNLWKGRHL